MTAYAYISGCAGTSLLEEEKVVFSRRCPWGLILFKRNIQNPAQVAELVVSFRELADRADAPVLIDQEGGRVQRLGPPHWPKYPAAAELVSATAESGATETGVGLGAKLIAHDLRKLGINVDCLPVADLRHAGAHDIIGDRAYGSDPQTVAALARAAADGLIAGGVLPVVKHIPGHGRALADSHLELPRVTATRRELEQTDFEAFRLLSDLPLAMTAHVVYEAYDGQLPATLSPTVMDKVIRGHIGFDGLVMTDDLSMKALSGSMVDRTLSAFAAGCDMALHCNGDMLEAIDVASSSPPLQGKALARAEKALDRIKEPLEPFDTADAWQRFSAMIGTA